MLDFAAAGFLVGATVGVALAVGVELAGDELAGDELAAGAGLVSGNVASGVEFVAGAAGTVRPVSADCPIDQLDAKTPRLSMPTMFLVAVLTRRTPLSEC